MELVTSEIDDRYISVVEGFTLVELEENMLEGMPYSMPFINKYVVI